MRQRRFLSWLLTLCLLLGMFSFPAYAEGNTTTISGDGSAAKTGQMNITLKIKGNPSAPAAPTSFSVTKNSVTLNEVSGCEYSMDGASWQDNTEFTGLLPGTEYTFYQRIKATDDDNASPASPGATYTTEADTYGLTITLTIKTTPDAPEAPTAASTTKNSVTLNAADGCEYSMDSTSWQDETTFSGLQPGTEYKFYQRIKATETANASASSPAATISTAADTYGMTITLTIEPKITGADLVLDGTLYLRFYVYLPTGVNTDGAHMKFTVPGRNPETGKVEDRTRDIALTEAGTSTDADTIGQRIFACPVYSIEMAKQVKAEFFYDNDSASLEKTYSVQDYLDTFTDPAQSAYALAAATRNYGYYMQPYLARLHGFNLTTDYPAMEEGTAIVTLDALPGFARTLNNTDTDVLQSLGYYDSFNESTTLTILVRLKKAVGAVTATVDNETWTVKKLSGNTYRIQIPNIAANNLGKAYHVVFSADGSAFCELSISALSYVHSVLAAGAAENDEAMALSAFYYYYDAAENYIEN